MVCTRPSTLPYASSDPLMSGMMRLCDVEEQEAHHESEQTSSFSESETQDGILEELTPQRWVARNTLDQSTENSSDTDTSSGKTNGGQTSSLNLGGSDHGSGGRLGDDTARLLGVADDVASKGIADGWSIAGDDRAGHCGSSVLKHSLSYTPRTIELN
jgi:hypothetical protein